MISFILFLLLFQSDLTEICSTPTTTPSVEPSKRPSTEPSDEPSRSPSIVPSDRPTRFPSRKPSQTPSSKPSSKPSRKPSKTPSQSPSSIPSQKPSNEPSKSPSVSPSSEPTVKPSTSPSAVPSMKASMKPSSRPTRLPSFYPSRTPKPSARPSIKCADDIFFHLDSDILHTCRWIGNSDDRNTYCTTEEVYTACPVTCGICCGNDNSFTFKVNGSEKDCNWVEGNLARQLLYCSIPTNGVKEFCAKSCDACNEEAPYPSQSPSSSPTVDCLNDSTYYYLDPQKTCWWIDKKASRRKLYCQTKEVWQHCPLVCGICCQDDSSFTFDIGGTDYDCEWVHDNDVGLTYCNDDSIGVFDACPKTCNDCRPNVVIAPTPPPVTPWPTEKAATASPVKSPSRTPSSKPSMKPSFTIPTSSPTGYCIDDTDFYYLENHKTCEWIDEKGWKRKTFCKFDSVVTACPRTCGACCRDNDSFQFWEKNRTCNWVGKKTNRKNKFCSTNTNVILNCPDTCKTCRNAPKYPTPSPSTSAPTKSRPPSSRPSIAPSLALSSTPTDLSAPSSAPTVLCVDDPVYIYEVTGRTCAFIDSDEYLRSLYCPFAPVKDACPKTCGVCCNDDPSFRFENNGRSRTCEWLGEVKNRPGRYCNSIEGVDDGCIYSCESCRKSY